MSEEKREITSDKKRRDRVKSVKALKDDKRKRLEEGEKRKQA